MKDHLEEECANCGLTFGSHYAGTESWPKSYCPGHEGKMDWEEGPGTTFKPTGARKKTKIYGQTAKNYHNPQGFNKKGE